MLPTGSTVYSADQNAIDFVPHMKDKINDMRHQKIVKAGIKLYFGKNPQTIFNQNYFSSSEFNVENLLESLRNQGSRTFLSNYINFSWNF